MASASLIPLRTSLIALTPHHTKYFAHLLTRRCASDEVEKLAGTLVDAQVDLNPHQVEAALFAFRSPLSTGALLADEVGLGKTIEAGLVVSQKWAEHKRRILIITPANLRKQWRQELGEKFFLPAHILETRSYNQARKQGTRRPFEPGIDDSGGIVICSYQFAKGKADEVQATPWDLVVIDEAHRLRNVYKPNNVTANALKTALAPFPKLLLTATPLQNSLLELYGLVSFIDDHVFGDVRSFREQYVGPGSGEDFDQLKARLQPVCHRTLRRQVTQYVNYTRRHAIVQAFTPADDEERLYHLVSNYLQRPHLFALPPGQRNLITLVLRKLLASSSFAIAGALDTMIRRLEAELVQAENAAELAPLPGEDDSVSELGTDYEALEPTTDEWAESDGTQAAEAAQADPERLTPDQIEALRGEIHELRGFRDLAVSIPHNAKGDALLTALAKAFSQAQEQGAAEKAIVFTESRKTQDYLVRLLQGTPHGDGIVLFNGTNTDPGSAAIYHAWRERHQGTDLVTGSRTADMRSALVEEFRDRGRVMIATEAGAEGINLQFCSLVVNYDLPWNPQRIEQRIGRCHRYGQKHDVVVVNFLNESNEADRRVYELLEQKFNLFEGVFGSSDEILGAVESGVDFEKRIAGIYQRCRNPEDIARSFEQLQKDLAADINLALTRTRQHLLEHFDAEVSEKLKISLDESRACLTRYERMLMQLTRHELGDAATFPEPAQTADQLPGNEGGFDLIASPTIDTNTDANTEPIALGRYELPRRNGHAHFYRLGHPLARHLIHQAKTRRLATAELIFDATRTLPTVAALEARIGQRGTLKAVRYTAHSLDQPEDHVLVAAVTDAGETLPAELAHRFFSLEAAENSTDTPIASSDEDTRAAEDLQRQQNALRQRIAARNAEVFEQQAEKLDGWAEDLKLTLERDIKDLDRQIREAKRAATLAPTLDEKLAGQKAVRGLEAQRTTKRRSLFEAQDEIDARREQLIGQIEGKLGMEESTEDLFTVRWKLV